jgi:mRNA-degrading endonuclease RelE of RelBE toxin-antitoxin system
MFSMTHEFRKQILKLDKKMEGRVMAAIVELCRDPLTLHGDTEKILINDMRGLRRYRLGDYRLIYRLDKLRRTVFLLAVGPRGGIYGD